MRVLLLVAALALVSTASVQAQSTPPPEAAPADVASTEAILETIYEVISGPATEARDWDRFRSLMHPDAHIMPAVMGPYGARPVTVLSVDEYIEWATVVFRDAPMFQGKGFYEVESARRVERYGTIAHVWSTYESRLDPAEEPFARGINSFQLYHDGTRWWVLSIFWEQESEAAPLPGPYLMD